jgi:hypothetical protein
VARFATIKLMIILACEACGRVDFEAVAGDGGSLHAPLDAAPDAVLSRIAYLGLRSVTTSPAVSR